MHYCISKKHILNQPKHFLDVVTLVLIASLGKERGSLKEDLERKSRKIDVYLLYFAYKLPKSPFRQGLTTLSWQLASAPELLKPNTQKVGTLI